LSLRQEANRSTPSLLSHSSPPRRSPSPAFRQSHGNPANDWAPRHGSTSGNTSPARSTFSLASTVNLYATVTATPNATAPGKLAPSSPLYYDYTEDFEVDSYNRQAETLCSPTHFSIHKPIPEERPLSVERPSLTEARNNRSSYGLQVSSSPAPTFHKSEEGALNRRTLLLSESHCGAIQRSLDGASPEFYSPAKQVENHTDKKVIRLSGLGYGARELSTHVEEAFQLLPTTSFEISVSHTGSEESNSGSTISQLVSGKADENTEVKFTRSSSNRIDAHPPRSSSLPAVQSWSRTDTNTTVEGERIIVDRPLQVQASHNSSQLSPSFSLPADLPMSEEVGQGSGSAPSNQSQIRSSSGFKSSDTGFAEFTDLIKTLKDSNRAKSPEKEQTVLIPSESTLMLSPTIPNTPMLQEIHLDHSLTAPVSFFNRSSAKDCRLVTHAQPLKRTQGHNGGRKMEISTLGTYQRSDVPNFSHQMTMRVMPRSGSPMLAPKPISPARQLKLKNSVPQLMKALPPLPPEPPVRAISPPHRSKSSENELPCRISPLLSDTSATPAQETSYEPGKMQSLPGPPVPAEGDMSKAFVGFGSASSEAITAYTGQPPAQTPQPAPRLRLKMRNSATLQTLFPPGSTPWNSEESSTWSTADLNSPLPLVVQAEKSTTSKPPKFRLKITRASGSTYGTVRVNRDSGESKASAGFHLQNHKDIFTSTAGIDNIFRQVSQSLHSRKASAISNNGSESPPASTSTLSQGSHPTSVNTSLIADFNLPRSQSAKPLTSTEAYSVFSDDSSHIQGLNSMRGRLSNLRARIAVPYVNRTGSQSYDDLTGRDRNRRRAAAPMAKGSISNSQTDRKSIETRPLRRFTDRIRHHRLKGKVQGWLRETRSAIASRMKSRITAEASQLEVRV
jgi:hypothetical protein